MLGVLLFSATLLAGLLFLMDIEWVRLWLLGVAIVSAVAFFWWERRSRDPFIDLRVLGGNTPLLLTYARSVLGGTVSYAYLYGYAQWLEGGRGLSPATTGLILLPTFAVGILVATQTARRAEVRWRLVVGAVAQIVMAATLLFVPSTATIWSLVLIAVLFGIPQGLVYLAIQNSLYHQADPARMGASAGLLRTFMYIGAILAASATGVFFPTTPTTVGLHGLAVFMVCVAAVLLLITLADRSLGMVDRIATNKADR